MNRTALLALVLVGLTGMEAEAQDSPSETPQGDSVIVYVRSEKGKALRDVIVQHLSPPGTISRNYMTDTCGRVLLARAPQHLVRLRVRQLGYLQANLVVDLDTVQTALVVVLKSGPSQLDGVCTTQWVPAVQLLLDKIRAEDTTRVRILVRDGTYEDVRTIRLQEWIGPLDFAGERAGSYDLEVRASGYQTWRRNGVRVTKGRCHVGTVVLQVRLVPTR